MENSKTKMESRIMLEKQNKSSDQVTELNLDNCQAPQISGLTDEFVNLENLSMINVGLTTLKGFPKLPKLKKLEIADNRITCGLHYLHGCPRLEQLILSGNRIKDLAALEPLKEFKDLIILDLFNCEVTKSENYRKKVFEMLPNLRSLDGCDQNEKEVDLDDEEDEDEEEESEDGEELENGKGGKVGESALDDDDDDDEYDESDEYEGDDDEDGDDDEEYDEEGEFNNGRPRDQQIGQNNNDESDDDGDEDDDDVDDEDIDSDGNLQKLTKGDIADESDDGDFEPTGKPDPRDYEIDEEDLDEEVDGSKQDRGQKRKHEDEGGDEVVKE